MVIVSAPPPVFTVREGRSLWKEREAMGTAARGQGHTEGTTENEDAVSAAMAILPAWLTERMMMDEWLFGLLLATGHVVAIQRITAVTRDASGTVWLDVILATEGGTYPLKAGGTALPLILAPTDRREASINATSVVMALELTTS
jgi:hypothetical protein